MTNELIQKARECKSAEEILALAKENGIEMTAEMAEECYAKLHTEGEMTDDELDNVSGGGCLTDFVSLLINTSKKLNPPIRTNVLPYFNIPGNNKSVDDGIIIGDGPNDIPMDDSNKIINL